MALGENIPLALLVLEAGLIICILSLIEDLPFVVKDMLLRAVDDPADICSVPCSVLLVEVPLFEPDVLMAPDMI